jgi:CHAT domain-containing protein
MQNVEQHFDPKLRDVSSGQEANPAEYFKSKPETFSYIHFVAHGTASQLSPLDSAVILSKATKEDDSYKLHARDIVGHRLRADLVVISACYGSGTTLYNGEGLVGLSWAFVRAGAHNVIGALWQVNDTSTPRLMDQMYAEIQKGKSPQEALRTAKLSLLHSDSSFRKPIYWAPFQFYTGS